MQLTTTTGDVGETLTIEAVQRAVETLERNTRVYEVDRLRERLMAEQYMSEARLYAEGGPGGSTGGVGGQGGAGIGSFFTAPASDPLDSIFKQRGILTIKDIKYGYECPKCFKYAFYITKFDRKNFRSLYNAGAAFCATFAPTHYALNCQYCKFPIVSLDGWQQFIKKLSKENKEEILKNYKET